MLVKSYRNRVDEGKKYPLLDIMARLAVSQRGWAGGNSHDHLLTAQQRVADELASSKRHGAVVVRHGCGCGDGLSVMWVTEERTDGEHQVVNEGHQPNRKNSDPPVSLNWVQP